MNGTVFVLGAGGFIGGALCRRLAIRGWAVLAGTRRPTDFDHPRIRNVIAPFGSAEDFRPWVAQCRMVVHAASHTTPSSSAALPQLDGNLRTTLALIEALQEYPEPRVVFLSSGGTLYGDTPRPVNEGAKLHPRSYHAAGKIAAEYFLQAWAVQYSGDVTILRPSNIYGPGQLPKSGFGIIPAAFERALDGAPLSVLGDGGSVRDYLYIEDFVRLCELIFSAGRRPGARVLNAASGRGLPLNALLDAIDHVTGRPLLRHYESARVFDVQRILLDNGTVSRDYGWEPYVSIEDGLRAAWAWRLQCP